MAGIREYKCLSCGAPLEFDAGSQEVQCHSCGNSFTVEALQAANEADAGQSTFDWGDYKKDYEQGEIEGASVYLCESCGAEIEADANTAATRCPYCDNNVVLTDRVSGGLKPNGIIPFKITKEQLPEYLKKFYKGKSLLPRGFFSNHVLSKAQGVYVPFWLYGCHLSGSMDFDARVVRSYRQGDYDVTETSYYLLRRRGQMDFKNVPVDASLKMANDLMDSLEPFDFNELKPFDGAYLSGFVADRFDSNPDDELDRAESRMLKSAADEITRTADYGIVTVRSNNLHANDASVRYVLLPVYLLNCEYGGKKYQYAVNGQTGKVVGDLPVSKGKSWGWFGGAFAVIGAIIFGLLTFLTN